MATRYGKTGHDAAANVLMLVKAMTIVTDRLNASKPPPDTKGGKLAPGALNNNKDLDVDPRKEEPSFFGSFFSAAKNTPKKKGAAVMDTVSAVVDTNDLTYPG